MPYQVRNSILVQEKKARVRYQNGITLPVSAQVLLANATRQDYNHRRRLSSNIVAAGQSRPVDACAHHIVALRDADAVLSRKKLFDCAIGINDADNGVFLPRSGNSGLVGYPNAPRHAPIHAPLYHATVYARLRHVKGTDTCRVELRDIKTGLLAGAFPW